MLICRGCSAEPGVLLLYVMTIADEVDSQLAQAMTSFIEPADHDAALDRIL